MTYDIGLKRDNGGRLRGNLKNLTIIGRALNAEEIANISGEWKDTFCSLRLIQHEFTKKKTKITN